MCNDAVFNDVLDGYNEQIKLACITVTPCINVLRACLYMFYRQPICANCGEEAFPICQADRGSLSLHVNWTEKVM